MSEPATGRYAEQLFTKMTVTVTMSITVTSDPARGVRDETTDFHIRLDRKVQRGDREEIVTAFLKILDEQIAVAERRNE